MADEEGADDAGRTACSHLHLRWGWWSLLFFLAMGMSLELLHGFKVGWYLDVGNETRRLMFTLSHSHGALFALVNIAFALTLRALPGSLRKSRRLASRCLLGASVIMPGGFLLGGISIHSSDPGAGILLVPVGAALLFAAVLLTAWELGPAAGPAD